LLAVRGRSDLAKCLVRQPVIGVTCRDTVISSGSVKAIKTECSYISCWRGCRWISKVRLEE